MNLHGCSDIDFCVFFGFDSGLIFYISDLVVFISILIFLIFFAIRFFSRARGGFFEIDEAEFGIGSQRLRIRPNYVDRQIAYKIWVELSTRKIGIPIDLSDDVIVDIYSSWYNFFSVTRELIKEIPVSKFRNRGTQKIVGLSIDVLTEGIRPHLTKWQARFRHWYDFAILDSKNTTRCPQEIQKDYSDFDALRIDILRVNSLLIKYRKKMYELISD